MDKKYKILWLDDEFEDSTSSMSKSLEEFEESPFSLEFEVTKVSAAGGFRNMFVSTYFDAVILDVWGKDNFDDSDLSATGFRHALEPIVNTPMVKIVYTGKGEEQPYAVESAEEKGCCVIGKKDCPVPELFEIIREKLKDRFSIDFPCVSDILKGMKKIVPGYGKKIGEKGFEIGTEILKQGTNLKLSGAERITDMIIEKKQEEAKNDSTINRK